MADKEITCPKCNGGGSTVENITCNGCGGSGKGTGMGSSRTRNTCSICHGKGTYSQNRQCSKCGGRGKIKKGGCFITTATMYSLGKGDNCTELESFRYFRDTYVEKNYPELIQEYYHKAPIIVSRIENSENSSEKFKAIWKNHLSKAYEFIQIGENENAYKSYLAMMKELEN